ncbi:hypothetical protein J4N46_11425 [Capnocytophaga sp. Marseille-Q4570]|uniref:DUF4919 domain-containing protein n=1 Tax=Capnocytophaga bilenii TaxID=2819369 RepID=A0ABS3Q0B4_9FLAO|nr:hypothetical protein [Capnocytophaga bilenii]MBO1885005.1 hypothetical protein [Capnocytophaga bilenii]
MKKSILFGILLWCSAVSFSQNIEDKVEAALQKSYDSHNAAAVETFLYDNASELSDYWKAYIKYREASKIAMVESEKKEYINEAIKLLEHSAKDAEDYILLALAQNYALQFVPNSEIYNKVTQVISTLQKAEKLDPENARLYLVKAIQDMYTPAKYGGGKNAELYFNLSLSLFENPPAHNKLKWGKEDARIMLGIFRNGR